MRDKSEDIKNSLIIRPFRRSDEPYIVQLWQSCGLLASQNDPHKDIQTKLAVQPELFLAGELSGSIIASVMAGYEGHRGWINYLAVSPAFRKKGYGRRMTEYAEARLRELGCPKINLQIRTSNTGVIAFYKRIGFFEDDVISMGKRL